MSPPTPDRVDGALPLPVGRVRLRRRRGGAAARRRSLFRARARREPDVAGHVGRIRAKTDLPVAVGFGIRTPEQAAEIASVADAAVVGSALVDRITANLDDNGKAGPGTVDAVLDLVRTLAEGVRNAQNTEKAS